MISSVPSYDEELLNSAYANIGLIADKGWAYHRDDPFRKLNHTLWVQNCKLTARYRENGNYQPRCVRDRIPGSRLAQYGRYEYNEERERMYKPIDDTAVVRQPGHYDGTVTEPWMLEEVEEHFSRLNFRASMPLDDESLTQQRSSATAGPKLPSKDAIHETGRMVQFKLDDVLRNRYPTFGQALAAKNSNGKDSPSCSLHTTKTDEPHYKNVDPEDYDKYPPPRYTIDNMAQMQLQVRITSDTVRDLWNPLKTLQQQRLHFEYSHRQQQHLRCGRQKQHQNMQHHLHSNKQQQYLQCSLQHQTLPMRSGRQTSSTESFGMMRHPPPPLLRAEVPEFFPKRPINRAKGYQEQPVPLQFFPSSTERSYQDELFPYNRGHVPGSGNIFHGASVQIQQISHTTSMSRPSHQWIQRPSPALHVQVPICPSSHQSTCTSVQSVCPTIIQRRVQVHDKLVGNVAPQIGLSSAPIPVYQRPPELYNDPSQKRKNQGVDFNNLILLTKSAMKAKRSQSKNNTPQTSNFVLDTRPSTLKAAETDVLQWFEKGYSKRTKELEAVNTIVSDMLNFEGKSHDENTVSSQKNMKDVNCHSKDISLKGLDKSPTKFSEAVDTSSDAPTRRRLYRDVLTNSSAPGIMMENIFDKRYDELERQAMEQYRTSEECLALRYQELERQAMEQYRNSDNGAGNSKSNQSQSSSPASLAQGQHKDKSKKLTDETQLVEDNTCSGFGHCNPIKDSASEKGTPPRQPITILRPENKPGTSASHRGTNHNTYPRPAVVTRSLTTLGQKFSRDSKNTIRGASGDKIDRNVQSSSKRRLILMSPSKRESEVKLSKTTDLGETCAFRSMNRQVSGSYRESEVIQTGGGDEKITILRSPGAEGIRKQLFLTNEELMDDSSESLGVRLLEPTQEDGPSVTTLVKNLEKQTNNGVSSEKSIGTILDATRHPEEEQSLSLSGIRHLTENQQEEVNIIPNRVRRNKKKQCKPCESDSVKDDKSRCKNVQFTKSITFSLSDEKNNAHPYDTVTYSDVMASKMKDTNANSHLLYVNVENRCKSTYSLARQLSSTTLEKQTCRATSVIYLPHSTNAFQSARYIHMPLCNHKNIDTLKNGTCDDSCLFETAQMHLQKTVQYYEFLRMKFRKLYLENPCQVVPVWDNNSKMNSMREAIGCRTATWGRTQNQTTNLFCINHGSRFHPIQFGVEPVRYLVHDNLLNLQILSPSNFVQNFCSPKFGSP